MLKKVIIMVCLLSLAGVLYAAENLHKIKGIKAGYSDTTAEAKPESTALKHIKYHNPIGFPVNNREVGVELPSLTVVNKLVLEMELVRKESEMSRFGIDKEIKLYASKDNITFQLVKPCEITLKIFKRNGKNWVSIEITGFAVEAKYLKLCPRKGIKGYAGVARKFQQAFSVYKEK
jgi:hypothetical protein